MQESDLINARVDSLAKRLDVIEEALAYLIEEKESGSATKPVSERPETFSPPAPVFIPRPTLPTATSKPTNWLGTVSVICFILAAAFIIKLAIDSGWLTPPRQIGLAAVLGFSLIGAGFALMRFDKAYASLLPAAGVIILYLTSIAAHSYHGLISFQVALGFVALVSALSLYLYGVIRNDVFPLTAAVGAYLAPFLLGAQAQTDFTIYYHVACSIAFACIASWLESRLLAIVASYMAIGSTLALAAELPNTPLFVQVLVFHFTIFVTATVLQSVRSARPLTENESWAYLPVLLLFYVGEYHLIQEIAPKWAPWISLVFAAFLVGAYFISKKSLANPDAVTSGNVIAAFPSLVLFHSLYLEILGDDLKPWLLPFLLLGMVVLPLGNLNLRKAVTRNSISLIAVLAVIACEYARIFLSLVGTEGSRLLILNAFISCGAAGFLYSRTRDVGVQQSPAALLLGGAHGLAIVGFYRLMEPLGSLAVSASWLAYAVVIMLLGFRIRDKVVAKSALGVLGLSAAKALVYDASSAETPVRIACLLVTGVVLYGAGLVLKRIEAIN